MTMITLSQTRAPLPAGLHGYLGLGATGYPGIATGAAKIYASPSTSAKVLGTIPKGTGVTVTEIGNGGWLHIAQGWVQGQYFTDNPNALPSDGVAALQQALRDLSTLGYATDPGETSGTVGPGTVRAMITALGVVGGEIKGGQTTSLAIQAALSAASVSGRVDDAIKNYVRQYAKPLAIAIQIFVAKKRGSQGAQSPTDYFIPTGNTTPWGLYAIGAVVVLGGLYILLRK